MESLLAGFAPSHGVHCRYTKAVDGKWLQVLDVIGGIVAWRYDFFCCVPCSTYSRSENNRPLVVNTVRVNMSDDLRGKAVASEAFVRSHGFVYGVIARVCESSKYSAVSEAGTLC